MAKQPTPPAKTAPKVAAAQDAEQRLAALSQPDAQSPKAIAVRQKKMPPRARFEVLKPQIIDGKWVSPADGGDKPVIVELLEVQAGIRLAQGKLKRVQTAADVTAG